MNTKEETMSVEKRYHFPVWATQGGGLVREIHGTFIFVTQPDVRGLGIGDEMPEEWGIAPANKLAQQEIEREEFYS